MGWATGSELADDIWMLVHKYIPINEKKKIARKFINIFETFDCDTMSECEQLFKDAEFDPNTYGEYYE